MRHFNRFPSFILISFAGVFFAGCIIPIPTPTRIRSATGFKRPKHVDLGFVRPARTRREEVLQKLSWADAGIQNKQLFLARWNVSHMAVCVGVAAPQGYGAGAADCGSIWQARNLIVEFDEHGIVQKVQRVRDRDLGKELLTWANSAQHPPLYRSRTLLAPVRHHGRSGTIALGQKYLDYQCKGGYIRLPRKQILAINTLGGEDSAYSIRVQIRYWESEAVAKKLRFRMSPSNLLELIEYFEQTHAQKLPAPGIPETDKR